MYRCRLPFDLFFSKGHNTTAGSGAHTVPPWIRGLEMFSWWEGACGAGPASPCARSALPRSQSVLLPTTSVYVMYTRVFVYPWVDQGWQTPSFRCILGVFLGGCFVCRVFNRYQYTTLILIWIRIFFSGHWKVSELISDLNINLDPGLRLILWIQFSWLWLGPGACPGD